MVVAHPMFDPWVSLKKMFLMFVLEKSDFPKKYVSQKKKKKHMFFEGWGLFLAPGTMKIESEMLFFIFWLWEADGG